LELKPEDTFSFALGDALVFDGGGLGFVLLVLQVLSLLPPHLQRTDGDGSGHQSDIQEYCMISVIQ